MNQAEMAEEALRAYDIAIRAKSEQRASLDKEIEDLIKARERMQRQKYKHSSANGAKSGLARGEAKFLIAEFLRGEDLGATQVEIADETGVSISTVGRVLRKHPDLFKEKAGGSWGYIGTDSDDEQDGEDEVDPK